MPQDQLLLSNITHPPLPPALIILAAKSLPDFITTLHPKLSLGQNPSDFPEFLPWDMDPPYDLPDTHTPEEVQITLSIRDMHERQLYREREKREAYMSIYNSRRCLGYCTFLVGDISMLLAW
ncbi:hypothetical protein SERLA73DRAFT_68293 [Serpula lacrymans var. lacrymans S7.3]|uniref:Uncharacterized protein n=2 Tax=Serpula lacrymans var. lacrymans TaxID=341189 RepID=F8PI28_SERL3|nr:uncharacterized protein SERLADRAFT_432036 [Serpula lacrymans var. lacrymans S7.9]EGO04606.1 hypothetical protein SERLA73DRAFT_68293 [Serpula lacrymans var. lacrymans S7.3]EGO30476.1 hypothetical protein SERLADRAFT_432036 [Serpula lacrymans var. lacrymans S7.9]